MGRLSPAVPGMSGRDDGDLSARSRTIVMASEALRKESGQLRQDCQLVLEETHRLLGRLNVEVQKLRAAAKAGSG